MQIAITILLAVVGTFVGSFVNVVVIRLHSGKQFVKGRSRCPHCKHVLGAGELVPVVSWVVLKGRCRHCGKSISPQYPMVEAATAAVFALAYLAHPVNSVVEGVQLALWLFVIASLVALAVYDWRWQLLPDKLLLPLVAPATILILIQAVTAHSVAAVSHPLAAAALFGSGFYLLALLSGGRWMGGGDIKLAAVMGLLLGLQRTALAMFVAFDVAAVVGIALILVRRKKTSDQIPFGPFLVGGTLVAYYFGTPILHWYLRTSGLA